MNTWISEIGEVRQGGEGEENNMVEFEVNSRTQLMMEKAKEKQREGVHCLQTDILTPECFR